MAVKDGSVAGTTAGICAFDYLGALFADLILSPELAFVDGDASKHQVSSNARLLPPVTHRVPGTVKHGRVLYLGSYACVLDLDLGKIVVENDFTVCLLYLLTHTVNGHKFYSP